MALRIRIILISSDQTTAGRFLSTHRTSSSVDCLDKKPFAMIWKISNLSVSLILNFSAKASKAGVALFGSRFANLLKQAQLFFECSHHLQHNLVKALLMDCHKVTFLELHEMQIEFVQDHELMIL